MRGHRARPASPRRSRRPTTCRRKMSRRWTKAATWSRTTARAPRAASTCRTARRSSASPSPGSSPSSRSSSSCSWSLASRALREIEERDLLDLHLQELAPNARAMAAAEKAATDLEASLARWRRMLRDPAVTARAVDVEGTLAGYVCVFLRGDVPEVAYWLDEP